MHELKVMAILAIEVPRRRHRMEWIPFATLLLAQLSATVLAQDSSDPMEVCYRMSDADLRHACFDREMQRRHSVAATAGTGSSAPRSATVGPADTVGLDGRQLIIKRREAGIQPEPVKPIVAALTALKPRPGHLYYFALDNGQVWESTDSEADLFLDPRETVSIRPGVLGAFFLKTPEGRSIRVHRLR
jgi:hypothetical protein